jgi:GNAT superfamily N-acetyltransferase
VSVLIRQAHEADAPQMSALLTEILKIWNSNRPSDPAHVNAHYITHPHSIACSVAEETGEILGFQSLKRAWDGNPYDVPKGWGIIGSYVRSDMAGRGIGRQLFARSNEAARTAGLIAIDATIADDNAPGLAYYDAMGFETYRTKPGAICKAYRLNTSPV